jgi:hypothetical protein
MPGVHIQIVFSNNPLVVEYIFSILSAHGRHLAILLFGKSLTVAMKSTPKTKVRISGLENSKYYQNGILKALTDHLVGGSGVVSFDPHW